MSSVFLEKKGVIFIETSKTSVIYLDDIVLNFDDCFFVDIEVIRLSSRLTIFRNTSKPIQRSFMTHGIASSGRRYLHLQTDEFEKLFHLLETNYEHILDKKT